MDYVRYDSGRFVSEHDAKSGLGRTELVVPEDCGAARVFLQIRDAQLRHKQAEPRTPKHTRPRLSTGLPSYSSKPVLVEPILSGQHQGHRAGASFIYVTIPSFTIPLARDQVKTTSHHHLDSPPSSTSTAAISSSPFFQFHSDEGPEVGPASTSISPGLNGGGGITVQGDTQNVDTISVFGPAFDKHAINEPDENMVNDRSRMSRDTYSVVRSMLQTSDADFQAWPEDQKSTHIYNIRTKSRDFRGRSARVYCRAKYDSERNLTQEARQVKNEVLHLAPKWSSTRTDTHHGVYGFSLAHQRG
ncbi:hypothetical protein LTR05_008575 [Lithohypha guttulata]|uniref:Uncharacterized protein n=1 Tax=Lithohypha guttulata TaxID=1690604 RepID=A0AAN7QAD3_9EURO|nr:hypothetical protein LTR05_008575 [Lithohypha guttulata]